MSFRLLFAAGFVGLELKFTNQMNLFKDQTLISNNSEDSIYKNSAY